VFAAELDPSGARYLTASGDKTVTLWDAASHVPLRSFVHVAPVRNAAISPDGTLIAGVTTSGVVEIWDAIIGIEVGRFRHGGPTTGIDFGPSGLLTTSVDGHAIVWDTSTNVPSPAEVRRLVDCRLSRDTDAASRDTSTCD
jgi:WD40 repeat protein